MAVSKIKPVHVSFATIAAFAAISTTPVLAAPDRTICDETAAPTLDITTTEFAQTADTDASIELLGPNFELASRETPVRDDEQPEQSDAAIEEDVDTESRSATVPADAGPLVHKRQMYRRDI